MAVSDRQPDPNARPSQRPPRAGWRPAALRWLDQHYNDVTVVVIALVTVLASLTAFLQSWAGSHYASDIRQSQTLATNALGHDMSSRQRESYDFSLYSTWNEWDWRHSRATAGDVALTAASDDIMAMISPLTPLLDENKPYYDKDTRYSDLYTYHADVNLVTTTLLLEQRAFTVARANVWNGKADGYVIVLTILAVSLFLYGLSTTIKTNLRYMFALVGTFLVGLAVLWVMNLTFSPVPGIPLDAVAQYARGQGLYYGGHEKEASEALEAALKAYPDYGNAYETLAEIHLDAGEYKDAAPDYRRAIDLGTAGADVYWNLGWAYYLAGEYGKSLEASRHALELAPELIAVRMNVGTALLAQGETEAAMAEYDEGLGQAADPNSPMAPSWSHLYLRETLNDLDRLINTLDGQTGFYQEPDLSNVPDRAALREAAAEARQRIKEGLVAIEATGSLNMEGITATVSPLAFARYVGLRGDLLGQSTSFPRGILAVVVSFSYDNLPAGAILSRRVIRLDSSGVVEFLPTMGTDITWSGDSKGTLYHEIKSPWPGLRGLLPGTYTVEYYVNAHLVQSGTFAIPDEDTAIVGPVVLSLGSSSGGVAYGPDSVFPAGVAQVDAGFSYSGLPENTAIVGQWYRNGQLYEQYTYVKDGWGSEMFSLDDVPAGNYRLDVLMDDQVVQSVEFQVVEIEAYLAAIGREPDEALFQRSLGDAYTYRGDYQQAGARYEKASALDPDCAECYHQWWSALYDQGQYQQAVAKLEKAIELRPRDYAYLCDLGKTYYQDGDDAGALEAYRRAVPVAPAYVYNAWGNALYDLGRNEEAVTRYQQAVELEPDYATYHVNLAGALSELRKYGEAVAEFAKAVEIDPSYDTAYNEWGNALYAQGQYADAAEKYQQAVDLEPGNATYHANLGGALSELERYEEAVAEFAKAVEIDPSYDTAYNKWGNALYAQGQYADAAEKYQQAVDLEPGSAIYHANLGGALSGLERYQEAVAEFAKAVEIDPSYDTAYNQWGNALYAQGQYADAAEKYQQAVDLEPGNAVYHYNLGLAHYELGQYDQAAAEFEQALTIDPNYASAYNRWGNTLYVQGDYAGAAEKYQLAIGASPDEAVYHYNLGLAYYQQQYYEQARPEFEQAVDLATAAGDENLRQDAEDMLAKLP